MRPLSASASTLFTHTYKRGRWSISIFLAGWKTLYDDILSHARGVFSFLATCYARHRRRVIKSILIDSTGRCNNKARQERKGGLHFSVAANRDDRAKPNKHHQRAHCKVNTTPSSRLYFLLTAAQTTARLCLPGHLFSLSLQREESISTLRNERRGY